MPCKYGKTLTECSKYISKDILQCEQIKELFMAKKEVDVGPLIVSFCLKSGFWSLRTDETEKAFPAVS